MAGSRGWSGARMRSRLRHTAHAAASMAEPIRTRDALCGAQRLHRFLLP